MRLLTTIFIGLICLTVPVFGQVESNVSELFSKNDFSTNSDTDLLFVCRTSADASKEEEWETGVLIDYNNKSHHVEGRYNVVKDEMQILLQNQTRIIFPQKIKAIKVGEMTFVPFEYEGDETLTYGYFQVLSQSKTDLLMKYENTAGDIKKLYYTRKKEEAAKLLKLNKAWLIKKLGDKKTAQYIKEKKLNVKKEKDLIEIFNYHNSLSKCERISSSN